MNRGGVPVRFRKGLASAAFIIGITVSVWPAVLLSAESLQDAMTPEDFRKAGLQRLSSAELLFLNNWLGRAGGREPVQSFGAEQLDAEPRADDSERTLLTRVEGDFSGWNGRTVFKLSNGQVWQQRLPGRYRYNALDPEVKLKRGRFGYYLELVASGRQIPVKRLK